MPQIDYDVWIQGESTFTGLNTRTGTAAITDQDYEDFAPFTLAYYPTGANKYTMWNWLNGGELSMSSEIDKSMCFVGIYNSDLPQLNIGAYAFDTYDTLDNPLYKTDSSQIQSYYCYDTWNFMFQQTQLPGYARTYADGRIYDKDFTYITNKLQIYKDGNVGTQPHVNPPLTINLHSWLNTYLSFGIKSLILEINVAYKTSDGTYYPNQARCTLAAYIANNTAWKEAHPILQAYCIPYIRDNINGTYSNTARYFESYNCIQTFSPAFTLPYLSQNSDYPDIITYTTTLADGQSTRNGYFPLYGVMVGELALSSSATAVQNMGILVPLMGVNKGTLGKRQSSGYMYYWLELEGTDENIEWLRRAAAAYGLFFCDSIGDLADAGRDETRWIDVNMCCGTIDDEGRTNGAYTRGAMNVLQKQFNWSDSTESPFDPSAPPVPENEYNTQTVFNTVSGISTMTQRYAMTAGAVKNLGAALWSISADLIDDGGGGEDYSELNEKILDTFLTNNPIDCIVSLRKYPFEISKDDSTMIKLGKYETTVGAYTMSETLEIFEFRMKNKILPIFNDSFMDYEPYTHFELYVPFCGTVSVEPADILGRQLSVKLAVDYSTGTCTAYILTDDLVIKTISGQIAIDIPVSGIQSVTAASQINNAIAQASTAQKNEQTSKLSLMTIAGMGQLVLNPAKSGNNIATSQINAERADYELQHQNIQPHLIGSASSAASWLIDFSCRLLIYYPTGEILFNSNNPPTFNPVKLLEYGHTVGFACCMTGALSSFSGLTVAVKADLNGITTNSGTRPATLQELQMIEAALNEGIIL